MTAISVTVSIIAVADRVIAFERGTGIHPWNLWCVMIHKEALRLYMALKSLISRPKKQNGEYPGWAQFNHKGP